MHDGQDRQARRRSAARQRRPAPSLARLRPVPNTFIAQTQPGFESIAWSEVAARVGAARELGRRQIPGRCGMTIFTAARADSLRRLRTAEDLFALAGYADGIKPERAGLEQVRSAVSAAPWVEQGLRARAALTPGSRSGRRLSFRVVARASGGHEFRRLDFQRAVEGALAARGDHRWRLGAEHADVEFWATLAGEELLIALRLGDERMRHRDYKVVQRPASLRPAVAAALAWLSGPKDDDVVLDPMCGAGTILIERAMHGRYRMLLGGDHDPEALVAARTNVGPRYKPIELRLWDASAVPLPDSSVTKLITNLPWGMRLGSHQNNRRLYPRLLAEFRRLLEPGGAMVLLTAETALMRELIARGELLPRQIFNVSILGKSAAVYVCR